MADGNSTFDIRQSTFALVGAGALGQAMARRLYECGYQVQAIISRKKVDAERLAREVDATVAGDTLEVLPPEVAFTFCCVPDDGIVQVATELANLPLEWQGRAVAHTSGVHTSDMLAPLRQLGAETMSFHPLQTFTKSTPPEAFEDVFIGIEGTPSAVAMGEQLAEGLGARPLVLSAEAKVRCHLAASIVSNFYVTLMHMADEVLASAGVPDVPASELLRPLVEQTWVHLQEGPPAEALTGPVRRGDVGTIEKHVDVLREHLPHLLPAYRTLAGISIQVAENRGLPREKAQELTEALFRNEL